MPKPPLSAHAARKVWSRQPLPAPPPPSPDDGLEELTDRETEVLALLAEPKTVDAISAVLGIAIRTVQTHIENLCKKRKLRSRTEAVAWFLGEVIKRRDRRIAALQREIRALRRPAGKKKSQRPSRGYGIHPIDRAAAGRRIGFRNGEKMAPVPRSPGRTRRAFDRSAR